MAVISGFFEPAGLILGVLGLIWAFWAIYRFVLWPALHPNAPREYPYLIPFVGHAISYFQGSGKLMQNAEAYFGWSNEPFALTLAGETIYIVTAEHDAVEISRNTTTISFEQFVKQMYSWTGVSSDKIEKMWTPKPRKDGNLSDQSQPAHKMLSEYHRQQLIPGTTHSAKMSQTIVSKVTSTLDFDALSRHDATISHDAESVKISLWTLSKKLFIEGLADAYMDGLIWKICPNLLEPTMIWERTSWKYIYQLPDFLARDMRGAYATQIEAFTKYFETPHKDRQDCAYFLDAFEQELRECDFNDNDVARTWQLHYWAVTGNLYRVTFWLVAYVVYRPTLLAAIRREVQPASSGDKIDYEYLSKNCPVLEASFNEMLRVVSEGTLAREIIAPTVISGKVLQEGRKVMIPWRQLHLSQKTWGSEAREFDQERFLTHKSASRDPSFHPFGSGNMLCPGRFFARHAVFAFLATLIQQYDIELPPRAEGGTPQEFPRIDESKPGFGSLPPVAGDDVVLVLRKNARA